MVKQSMTLEHPSYPVLAGARTYGEELDMSGFVGRSCNSGACEHSPDAAAQPGELAGLDRGSRGCWIAVDGPRGRRRRGHKADGGVVTQILEEPLRFLGLHMDPFMSDAGAC